MIAAMFALGVDTSTDWLSAAVCDDAAVLSEVTFEAGRRHAERIVDTIDRALRAAGRELRDLDLLAVAHGPGSFTGIRIGVATLKGLALGANKPLVGVSSLRALARATITDADFLCPLLDARMDEVFGATFRRAGDSLTEVKAERVGPIEGFVSELPANAVIFGDGAARYADRLRAVAPNAVILPADASRPSGATVVAEGLAAFRAGNAGDPASVLPVYLRQSQPEEIRRRAEARATV